MRKSSLSSLLGLLALAAALLLSAPLAAAQDSVSLVQDQGGRSGLQKLGAQGGEMLLWSGERVRFDDLLAPRENSCGAKGVLLCLRVVHRETPAVIDLQRFSSLEYSNSEIMRLTERSGRFVFVRHYIPPELQGQGKKEAGSSNCPQQNAMPQTNNFTLYYQVQDPLAGAPVINAVPFCQVKKLTVDWGAAKAGRHTEDETDEEEQDN